ncbi:MAG TPA: NAD-dependent epimerase/dehydratase family protein [Chloroflexota bacterium]|nr:NAD-dependent epimerase/dehydratase family protein [Chloroflexota bacterium]
MDRHRLLITGVAGFLGSNLSFALRQRGYCVVGLDDLSHGQFARVASRVGEGFQFIEADTRDRDAVMRASEGASCIIHLAEDNANCQDGSLRCLEVNLEGTRVALEAAVRRGARFVLGSTEDVYGKNSEAPLNEESALVMGQTGLPLWNLPVSKLLSEQLTFAFNQKHGLPVTILRYGRGYGENQPFDMRGWPISAFITSALNREPMIIHGDGSLLRSFTHVADLVAGTVLAIESPDAQGEILNLGSRDLLSTVDLAHMVWRLAGNGDRPKLEFLPDLDPLRDHGVVHNRPLDISKAHHLLGYEPRVPIGEGLRETIRWQAAALGVNAADREMHERKQ